MVFSGFDDEGVEFVEVLEEGGGWVTGKGGECELLQVGIAGAGECEGVTGGDAAQVFVDDHDGMAEGV